MISSLFPVGLLAADPSFLAIVNSPFGLVDTTNEAHIDLVDIDGDMDFDAFIGIDAGQTRFFRNTGNPAAPAFGASISPAFGISDVGEYATPAFGDIDGDGDFDALVGEDGGGIFFFRNTGNPTSPAFAASVMNPFGITDVGSFVKPQLVDIDGDSDLDLFIGEDVAEVNFFRNTGNSTSPAFLAPSLSPFGIVAGSTHSMLDFADLDGDGDKDLLLGVGSGDLRFQRNTGNSTNPNFSSVLTNPFGLSTVADDACPSMVDIDQDGDIDVFAGMENGLTGYFQNTSVLDTTPPTLIITRTDPDNTSESAVRFQLLFSEIVAPTFTAADVQLTGTLAANSLFIHLDPAAYSSHSAIVVVKQQATNGTIGFRVNSSVTDSRGNTMLVPVDSPLYTIANLPPGDVSKNGVFDLADVALLADANLGLVTLP